MTTPHLPAIVPMNDLIQLADRVCKAEGLVPKAFLNSPGKILAAMLMGQELGVAPMTALRTFHVVEGKPVASAEFWSARLRQHGYRLEWVVKTDEKCTLVLIDSQGNKSAPETWDKRRAEIAGLWGKNTWARHPQAMLSARCITSAARAFAAEVMYGCLIPDEAEDLVQADATVQDAPKKGMAGLGARLGVPPAEIQDGNFSTEKGKGSAVDRVAAAVGAGPESIGPAPFDLVEEAIEAVAQCDTEANLKQVVDRFSASKFGRDDAMRAKLAAMERLAELRQPKTEPADA